jgi:hypothetical protein
MNHMDDNILEMEFTNRPLPAKAALPMPAIVYAQNGHYGSPWILRTRALVANGISLVLLAYLALIRLLSSTDPWRRMLGIELRSEGSKFVLSAFGLIPPKLPDAPLALENVSEFETNLLVSLRNFLASEADARFALRPDAICDYREKTTIVDVTFGQFSDSGELTSLTVWTDGSEPLTLDSDSRQAIEADIVRAFNATHSLPEAGRREKMLRQVEEGSRPWSTAAAKVYGRRILESCLVWVDGDRGKLFKGDRFAPPDFRTRRSLPRGFMNLAIRRIGPAEIDCWLQLHHVGADGAPMQELLGRLERSWTTPQPVLFPSPMAQKPLPQLVSMPGDRDVWLGQDFLSFQPLLALRVELNRRHAATLGGHIPIAALLLWHLAREPEFAGVRFAVAVNVPARRAEQRAVDPISIRPADYLGASFLDYCRDFRELVVASRERRSSTWVAMQASAILPARLAFWLTRICPALRRAIFGTVCLSILRDAHVFVASRTDLGFDGGFVAIGNLVMPASSGDRVGCITVKGTVEQTRGYPAVLRRTLAACARELESLLPGFVSGTAAWQRAS